MSGEGGGAAVDSVFGAVAMMMMRTASLRPVLCLAALLLGACGSDGGSTEPSVAGNTILFTRSLNPGTDIAAVSDTGGSVTPLTDLPGGPVSPVVSPDRRWIAFNYYGTKGEMMGVYVMRADGSGVRAIPGTADFEVTDWGHEGMLIRNLPRRSEHRYYLVVPDGTAWTPLPAFDDAETLDLSPDGTRVTYTAAPDGVWNVFVAERDGTNIRRLSSGEFTDQVPSWSPDGKWVAFISTRDVWFTLWIASADGPQLQQVGNVVVAGRARWSPDGEQLVFASLVSERTADHDIFSINRDGSGLVDLTEGLGINEFDPVWVGE
jgi:Tol biopolymer transport system component